MRKNKLTVGSSPAHEEYLRANKQRTHFILFMQLTLFILLVVLWEMFAYFDVVDAFVFSCPSRIINTVVSMTADGTLFYHLGVTLLETFLSFSIIILGGILLAILLWWNKILGSILDPYLVVLNSLPKSALAPVFIVWLGANMKTIIVAAVSVALFGTIITLINAFNSVDQEKVKLIYTLGGSKKDVLFKVILPSNLAGILSLMKVNIGLSLVGVIIAEFIAANAGLGYLIIYGSQVFKLDIVMTSIVLLCIVATGLYKLLASIEKRLCSN